MLEKIRAAKAIESRKFAALKAQGCLPKINRAKPDFVASLHKRGKWPVALIAEYKCASPSRGQICKPLPLQDVAPLFANEAQAMSILTEELYFGGHLDYLTIAAQSFHAGASLPLLRKDFIFDKLQVEETALTPASAMLLMVRLVPNVQDLAALIELGASLGVAAVVEIYDSQELTIARAAGAQIILVNNRDLATLKVDPKHGLELIREYPPKAHETWICASGMRGQTELVAAAESGFQAALLGTSIMQNGTLRENFQRLASS
ncbi:MAG: indole-3-glycerol-phosphate synthase [Desulfovibrionaceae bacterium]|nr:indole-3-glycerol-phosphate synthase [Desulfovibrionaceae bacterium]